jgi:hypothetical protein
MKVTQELHDLGRSLWLDNITITRDLLAARCRSFSDFQGA